MEYADVGFWLALLRTTASRVSNWFQEIYWRAQSRVE